MAKIKFKKEEKEFIVQKIKLYFLEEMDQEIGDFAAGFLLDFFIDEIGSYFYNKAIDDAHYMLENSFGDLLDQLYER